MTEEHSPSTKKTAEACVKPLNISIAHGEEKLWALVAYYKALKNC